LAPVKCDVRLYQLFGGSAIERLRERVDNTLGKADRRRRVRAADLTTTNSSPPSGWPMLR
jgi:hypothetical protein